MIQNMKGNILDGASDRLIKCKGAQLAETLCAIRVLTDKSWEDLLALFLQKRLALLKENASATDSSVDVRLCQDIMDSHSTLQILYETFTSASQQHSQSSLLKHTLSTFLSQLACDDPKKSILNDWYAINANVSLLVPHILPALSRICVQEGEQDLKTETLQINANEWIQKSASEGMRRESETLLLNVKLGKELSEIRDQVIRCVARLECGIILEAANTPPSTAHIPPWSQVRFNYKECAKISRESTADHTDLFRPRLFILE